MTLVNENFCYIKPNKPRHDTRLWNRNVETDRRLFKFNGRHREEWLHVASAIGEFICHVLFVGRFRSNRWVSDH